MGFLDQLKLQATAIKTGQHQQQLHQDANSAIWPAPQVQGLVLDELETMVCGQPNRFA